MPLTRLRGLLILLCCLAAPVRAIEAGQPAEGWSLLSSEGMEIDFPRIAAGQPALLLFLPAACPGCAPVLAETQRLRNDYAAHQVEVYVLGSADAQALAAVVGEGHDFVLLPDAASVAKTYATEGAVHFVLVDQIGVVRAVMAPERDADWSRALRSALDDLLAP